MTLARIPFRRLLVAHPRVVLVAFLAVGHRQLRPEGRIGNDIARPAHGSVTPTQRDVSSLDQGHLVDRLP